jgi:hypothetical protein
VIEPLGGNRFRIGAVTVDRRTREIRLPGVVALRQGALEYLACAPGGKLYESLLRFDVDPYHLHLALLLIGLQPLNNLKLQGDSTKAEGDPVTISVAWQSDKGPVSQRAEALVWDIRGQKQMAQTSWMFTGSVFNEGLFAASLSKSLAALYNDPTAILNQPLPTAGDDTAYAARTEVLPLVGTAVEVTIRAATGSAGSKGATSKAPPEPTRRGEDR